MGAAFGATRTLLLFSDGTNAWLEQIAASASFEWRVSDAITLVAAGGGLIAGRLGEFETSPGGVGSVSISGVLLEQGEYTPFIQLSASAGASVMTVANSTYVGVDIRAASSSGGRCGNASRRTASRAYSADLCSGAEPSVPTHFICNSALAQSSVFLPASICSLN